MAAAAQRKKSSIWFYFKVCRDTKYARCKCCGKEISHGGDSTKTHNTTNLVSHLKQKHHDLYLQYKQKKRDEEEKLLAANASTSSGSTSKQLCLSESLERTQTWDTNDNRAKAIHRKIGEMIALDFQPLCVIEDRGFTSLVNSLEPRYILSSQ